MSIMEIIIIVGLIIGIFGVIVFYRRKSNNLESTISKRFSDQRQSDEIELAEKIQDMKTTIKILSNTKLSLEQKLEETIIQSRMELEELKDELELKAQSSNKKSLALGQNIIKGELVQILASFYLLTEYDSIALVSSVSKNAPFDLIGVKTDFLDFIEVKTGSTILSKNESNIKRLIEQNKVRYKIIEGRLPQMDLKIRE